MCRMLQKLLTIIVMVYYCNPQSMSVLCGLLYLTLWNSSVKEPSNQRPHKECSLVFFVLYTCQKHLILDFFFRVLENINTNIFERWVEWELSNCQYLTFGIEIVTVYLISERWDTLLQGKKKIFFIVYIPLNRVL